MKALHEELKELRLEKGITLEKIYDATKISISMLKKIEDGDFSVVPLPFMRAFLREYAEVIGIDPARVLLRFENKVPFIREPKQPEQPAKKIKTTEPEEEKSEQKADRDKRKPQNKIRETDEAITEPEAALQAEEIPSPEEITRTTITDIDIETEEQEPESPQEQLQIKPDMSDNLEKVEDSTKFRSFARKTSPETRHRIEIEEPTQMSGLFFIVFIVIIVIAALIIFWINKGF